MVESHKILLVGPRSSGKTTIANILGGIQISRANPTHSVRIVELDVDTESGRSISVELWDVAGDEQSVANFVPALRHEICGVVLVYSPTIPQQVQETKRFWYQKFVKSAGLHPKQFMVMQTGAPEIDQGSLPPHVQNCVPVQDPLDASHYESSFKRFVQTVHSFKQVSQQDDEALIMG